MAPLWTLSNSLSDICCSCCVVCCRNGLSTIEQPSPLFSPIAIVSWFANLLYFLLRILSVHIIVGFDCNPGVGCELLLCELVISDERKELKHEHLKISRANFYFLCARSIFFFSITCARRRGFLANCEYARMHVSYFFASTTTRCLMESDGRFPIGFWNSFF